MGNSWGFAGPNLNAPVSPKPLTPKPEASSEPPPRLVKSVREKIAEFKRRKAERRRGA